MIIVLVNDIIMEEVVILLDVLVIIIIEIMDVNDEFNFVFI